MTTKTYSINWYDRATDENTAIELLSMDLDDAIEEAEFMTDDNAEYFEVYDANDESGERLHTSK